VRAFVAIAVAPPALDSVADALARLREEVQAVRWVRPETVHVTLHFFADLPEDDVPRVLGAVGAAVEGAAPFDVRLGSYGSFADRGTPRVLWLGVDGGAGELSRLAAAAEVALVRAGFTAEPRPFRAHCTIGRPRVPWPDVARRAWKSAVAPAFSAFTCDRVTLFQSVPERGGTRYVVRGIAPFAARS
jgi:2'-5' RNA ligase